jgi:hypothetical protein
VCGARRALQAALWEAGLTTGRSWLFLFKCRPQGAYDQERAYATFVPLLDRQIREGSQETLAGLGNTEAGLSRAGATVKGLRGMGQQWADRPLILGYHPLAARRRPALFPRLVEDLRRAAAPPRVLRRCSGGLPVGVARARRLPPR